MNDLMDVDDVSIESRLGPYAFGEASSTQLAAQRGPGNEAVRKATRTHESHLAAIAAIDDEDPLNASKFEFVRNPRDPEGRKPGDPDFDHTRLQISPSQMRDMTIPQRTYWEFKKDNYDKVIFYQQGDFYNMFGPDAQIGIKEFDFKYNPKLDSVGFNRSALDKYLELFASRGYAVMVVEQRHTAETDLEKQSKKTQAKKEGEARLVTQQFTPGTRRQLELIKDIVDSLCMYFESVQLPFESHENSRPDLPTPRFARVG